MTQNELNTPMMKQYWEIKKKYPNELVFYRLGDFYELFFEDAVTASKLLDITLTKRNKSSQIHMAGIPYHAAETYISKLVQKGYSIVICDQVGEVEKAKLVDRKVTKIITPGTVTEENIVDPKSDNELISIHFEKEKFGIAKINVSTGDFILYSFDTIEDLILEIEKIEPSEILLSSNFPIAGLFSNKKSVKILDKSNFDYKTAIVKLKELRLLPKDYEGNREISTSISAALSIINYINDTQGRFIPYAKEVSINDEKDFLKTDWATKKNLDLLKSSYDDNESTSLFGVIDNTETPMGSRLLKRLIKNPLNNKKIINERLDIVDILSKNWKINKNIKNSLNRIYDIERIISRIALKSAKPRDLYNLKESLKSIKELKAEIETTEYKDLDIFSNINYHQDIIDFIEKAIIDEPPLLIKDGGVVKDKFDKELDELRSLASNSNNFILELEEKEQAINNIPNLRINFNKVSGYYIELTKGQAKNAPDHFIRRQTLKNVERYTTAELAEYELKAISAKVKSVAKEKEIYDSILELMINNTNKLKITADMIANLDILACFSHNVDKFNLTRPTFKDELYIEDGRHIVIENISKNGFTPNSLDMKKHKLLMITGPNMGGKSTFMRQNALIIILAHLGSFVPAKIAEIPSIDRIFSRIGASDNLTEGVSTFMMEMQETSNILKYATKDSFVIIDEIGRGTSTYDGLSLAWAIAKKLVKIECKTLFSTHYFELIELAENNNLIHNIHLDSEIIDGEIVFLHKIKEGSVDQSYGIHVAKLAGIEKEVLDEANKKISELKLSNKNDINEKISEKFKIIGKDINNITPIEALNILSDLLKNQGD